jgi:hypothetical protein
MGNGVVDTCVGELHKVKALADRAIAQLTDDELWTRLDPASNSVGVIMRHMAGNMRSRWTDFRTSDGEKPDRRRDEEFEDVAVSREALLAEWEDGWAQVFAALDALSDDDLDDTVYIREEPHTVCRAIVRQVVHYAGHAYQILAIGKHLKGGAWESLSIPRGQSDAFNQQMLARQRAAR